MSRPSPIHRDPDEDGDDFGCFSAKSNQLLAAEVSLIAQMLRSGEIDDEETLITHARSVLTTIGDGATDTVVKENVFQALADTIEEVGIEFDYTLIYGW